MNSSTTQHNIEKIANWIQNFRVAMLTTVDEETGALRSRPMAIQKQRFTGDLFFFTEESTSKVDEIQKDHEVNISMMSEEGERYLSLCGRATLVSDAGKMQEMWDERYRTWFYQGLDNPNLALLQVAVQSVEYWEGRNRMIPEFLNLV